MLAPILHCASPDSWLERALSDVDTLLHDHAHCEQKAASTMLSLVFRNPEPELAVHLSRMAREELSHFEMVLREMKRRGVVFGKLEPARYAAELSRGARKKDLREAMLDSFVIAALIEARSAERMELLAAVVPDPGLRSLYHSFRPAEERHWALMLELGATFGDPQDRLPYFAAREAELILQGEPRVRMHA